MRTSAPYPLPGCGAQSYRRRMPQRPSTLTPDAGPLHAFGAALRAARVARGLSQAKLAARLHYPTFIQPDGGRRNVSGDLLAKLEKAERWPNPKLVDQLDRALGADGALIRAAREAMSTPGVRLADRERTNGPR